MSGDLLDRWVEEVYRNDEHIDNWQRPFEIMESNLFYSSDEWRKLRYAVILKHGGCCQCCGARAAPYKPIHVDHIKPRSKFPELELEFENLQVLCADCNIGKGASDMTDWRP